MTHPTQPKANEDVARSMEDRKAAIEKFLFKNLPNESGETIGWVMRNMIAALDTAVEEERNRIIQAADDAIKRKQDPDVWYPPEYQEGWIGALTMLKKAIRTSTGGDDGTRRK